MSNELGGAASAVPPALAPREGMTPELADRMEATAADMIEQVQDPDEAEKLLGAVTVAGDAMRIQKLGADRERRWKVLRLKAERRYGELLPPAEMGAPKGNRNAAANNVSGSYVDPAQRNAQKRARKVAAIPKETFEEYVATAEAPSREGVLRATSEPKAAPRPRQKTATGKPLWEDESVLAWVARRSAAGRTRDQIMADADAGEHGWPLPGKKLPQNAADAARAILADRARRGDKPKPPPKESGKRLRELREQKRNGKDGGLWTMQVEVAKAVGVLEGFRLEERDWSEDDEMMVAEIYDDLERHARWVDAAMEVTLAHLGDLSLRRKIAKLKARETDMTSTPFERESAASRRAQLERRLGAKLSAGSEGSA